MCRLVFIFYIVCVNECALKTLMMIKLKKIFVIANKQIITELMKEHTLGGVFGQVAFLRSPNSVEQDIRVTWGLGIFFKNKVNEKKNYLIIQK